MRPWKADEKIQFNRSLTHCISHAELHKKDLSLPLFLSASHFQKKTSIISVILFFSFFSLSLPIYFIPFSPCLFHHSTCAVRGSFCCVCSRIIVYSCTCISCSNSVLRRRISTSSCCSAGVRSRERQTNKKRNEYQGEYDMKTQPPQRAAIMMNWRVAFL